MAASEIDIGYRKIRSRPWQSRAEYLVDDALMRARAGTDDEIRNMRPLAAPQELFPARTGFMKNDWTVTEVMNIDRQTPSYRSWISGMPSMKSSLADPNIVPGAEGSTRNSMGAMW
jgi:hypothetical protein